MSYGLEAGLTYREMEEMTPHEVLTIYRARRERFYDHAELWSGFLVPIVSLLTGIHTGKKPKRFKPRNFFRRPKRFFEPGED